MNGLGCFWHTTADVAPGAAMSAPVGNCSYICAGSVVIGLFLNELAMFDEAMPSC
jgi:hypothetical protein